MGGARAAAAAFLAGRVRVGAATGVVFAAALGLSAGLMFAVQPMFSKMALPLLGGSPGVWNTAVAFFQAALLTGYLYAHALSRFGGVARQAAIHGVVLSLGALALPISVSHALGAPPEGFPALWLIGLFAVSLGAPFFAISATAPLLQSWYARTRRADAGDPYHLYAASNLGSLAALVAYPLLIEPTLALGTQAQSWSWGYGLLIALILGCAGVAILERAPTVQPSRAQTRAARVTPGERLWWVALAAIPSSLLLGATTHIATDVASAPFLWAAPLALFLATFVIAFARRPLIAHGLALRLAPLAAIGAALVVTRPAFGWTAELVIHLSAFFLLALACHGELVRRRPHASRLTEFYLLMSLGGVIGGAFNAFLAPLLFKTVLEYPLAITLALLLLPRGGASMNALRVALACAAPAAAVAVALGVLNIQPEARIGWVIMALAAAGAVAARNGRLASALLVGLVMALGARFAPLSEAKEVRRGFFGVHRVVEEDGYRLLMHGTTIHGVEALRAERAGQPMAYYGPLTPIAQTIVILQREGRLARVGAVGLGAGSIACYAKPGEDWTFFEIDPLVRDLARNPRLFSFMTRCGDKTPVKIGDARLTLAAVPDGSLSLLILDAFASDTVPAHLLTREAVALYAAKLAPDGVLLFHISNRVMELEGPLADLLSEARMPARAQMFVTPRGVAMRENESSHVVIAARSAAALEAFDRTGRWRPPYRAHGRLWTDDYVNIPAAIWAKSNGWGRGG